MPSRYTIAMKGLQVVPRAGGGAAKATSRQRTGTGSGSSSPSSSPPSSPSSTRTTTSTSEGGSSSSSSSKTPRSPVKLIQKAVKKARQRHAHKEQQRQQERFLAALESYRQKGEEFLVRVEPEMKKKHPEFTVLPTITEDGTVSFKRPKKYQPPRWRSGLSSIGELRVSDSFDTEPTTLFGGSDMDSSSLRSTEGLLWEEELEQEQPRAEPIIIEC